VFDGGNLTATLEHLNIVLNILTACKSRQDIINKSKLPENIVDEVLGTLKKLEKIREDEYGNVCPIEIMVNDICACCSDISKVLGGEQV